MQFSCYIEVNIICLILSGIVYGSLRQIRSINSTPQMLMRWIIVALWFLCYSDIMAVLCRGRFFPGARICIELSNLIYLEMMPIISMLWLAYVCNRIGKQVSEKLFVLQLLPLILFTLVAIVNPFTNFLFKIDEYNRYSRGPGVFLHWIVSWFYLLYAGILSIQAIRSTTNWIRKREYKPLLYFLVLPTIGCVTQMMFYGITAVQVGITLSIVLISMQSQDNQITIDELTGINNRKAMRRFVDNMIHRVLPPNLMVMMIDVNEFKKINDTLGHSVGDIALCDTANILKGVCGKTKSQLFLSRYGGDEFVMIGREMDEEAIQNLVETIRQDALKFTKTEQKLYAIELSIGYTSGKCKTHDEFDEMLSQADEAMYADKMRYKHR